MEDCSFRRFSCGLMKNKINWLLNSPKRDESLLGVSTTNNNVTIEKAMSFEATQCIIPKIGAYAKGLVRQIFICGQGCLIVPLFFLQTESSFLNVLKVIFLFTRH